MISGKTTQFSLSVIEHTLSQFGKDKSDKKKIFI